MEADYVDTLTEALPILKDCVAVVPRWLRLAPAVTPPVTASFDMN